MYLPLLSLTFGVYLCLHLDHQLSLPKGAPSASTDKKIALDRAMRSNFQKPKEPKQRVVGDTSSKLIFFENLFFNLE